MDLMTMFSRISASGLFFLGQKDGYNYHAGYHDFESSILLLLSFVIFLKIEVS